MSDTDPDLDRLRGLPNAIPAKREGMTVAEPDGNVAAPIVCPEKIMPSKWLPGVRGEDRAFADILMTWPGFPGMPETLIDAPSTACPGNGEGLPGPQCTETGDDGNAGKPR